MSRTENILFGITLFLFGLLSYPFLFLPLLIKYAPTEFTIRYLTLFSNYMDNAWNVWQ